MATEDSLETQDGKQRRTVSQPVDAVCDAFEESWNSWLVSGSPRADQPRIEAYVARVSEDLRSEAREHLGRLQAALSARSNPVFHSGEFEFVRLLGHGGMGYVSLARNQALNGQLVAIKTVKPSFADLFNEREVKAGRLVHPNIVMVMKTGGTDWPYIVMEYIHGEDLHELVQRHGPMPARAACHIFQQVAEGLAHAHAENVLHRDIKPRNLMIDKSHKVKILDWGLSKHQDSEQTFHDASFGTWEYTAPEQMNGGAKEADERSDLYSLGASLYFALTGYSPFDVTFYDESINEARASYMADRGLSQRALDRIESDDVRDLILKLVSPKSVRPDDANEVAQHLQRLSGGSNASFIAYLRGSTPQEDTKRSSPPNRRTVLVVGGGVAAAAAVGALTTWGPNLLGPDQTRVQLARDIVSAPGLRGEWWFEEIPIFSPPVRLAIYERILRSSNDELVFYQNLRREMEEDVPEAYNRIADHSDHVVNSLMTHAQVKDVAAYLRNIAFARTDSEQYKEELNQFLEDKLNSSRPELVHLRANIRHYLATTPEERAVAESDYRQAVQAYRQASIGPLEVLACLDLCHMVVHSPEIKRRSADVELWIQEIGGELTEVTRVTASCLRMRSHMQRTATIDDQLQEELRSYKNENDLRPIAIHAAYIVALSDFEHWHFAAAAGDLSAVRDDPMLGESYFFQLLWFDQLIAMSEFYMGQYDRAVSKFQELIRDLEEHTALLTRKHADRRLSKPRQAVVWHECRRLEERLPNLLERQADCHLFGTHRYDLAHELLDKAEKKADQLKFESDRRARFVHRIRTKLKLARAMNKQSALRIPLALELLTGASHVEGDVVTALQRALDSSNPRDMSRDQLCSYLFCLRLWFSEPDFEKTPDRVDQHVAKLLRIVDKDNSPELAEFLMPCLLDGEAFYQSHGAEEGLATSPRQRLRSFLSKHEVDSQANASQGRKNIR